jgi:hypothetical protein
MLNHSSAGTHPKPRPPPQYGHTHIQTRPFHPFSVVLGVSVFLLVFLINPPFIASPLASRHEVELLGESDGVGLRNRDLEAILASVSAANLAAVEHTGDSDVSDAGHKRHFREVHRRAETSHDVLGSITLMKI